MSFLPFPAPRSIRPEAGPPQATLDQVELANKQLMTKTYACGANVIDFPAFYKQVKSLQGHPQCPHRPGRSRWPCEDCEKVFLEKFWSAAARFLDYFAEFYRIDTGLMHSVWFYLFDLWQESSLWLPHEIYPPTYAGGPYQAERDSGKMSRFKEDYKSTLELVDLVLGPSVKKELRAVPSEPIVYPPSGDISTPGGDCSLGPYLSGLKPWQQFLYNGSPGCPLDKTSMRGLNPNQARNGTNSKVPDEAAVSSSAFPSPPTTNDQHQTLTRHIPAGALAILAQRTKRETALLARLSAQYDANITAQNQGSNPFNLTKYENHALHQPTKPNAPPHSYTNMSGGTTTYYLTTGSPPMYRYQGYADPTLEIDDPSLILVDECVAMCMGVEPYVPITGESFGNGPQNWEEGVDVWVVKETKSGGESGKGKGIGENGMFDNFVGRDGPEGF